MNKRILLTASVFGALAVILGAFGAHALKERLDPASLAIWTKGVEYQFYHTFALLFLSQMAGGKLVKQAYWFFTIGIVFFSGSLYLLATRTILETGFVSYIGPITPIGGLLFILGWLMLFLNALKIKNA